MSARWPDLASLGRRLALLALGVTVWEVAARSGAFSPLVMPSIARIGREFWWLVSRPESLAEAWFTLERGLGGFALAAVVGVALGVLMGRSGTLVLSMTGAGNTTAGTGPGEQDRAAVVRALACVDLVVTFDDDTPLRLIEAVKPDVLVKGADYGVADIVGRESVESRGGRVTTVPLREGLSTSEIVRRIREGKGA